MFGLIQKIFGTRKRETPFLPVVRATRSETDGSWDVELCVRVAVYKDDGSSMYIAQCLDLDYMSSGENEDDAVKRFMLGLNDTVYSYLEEYGSLEKFVRPPAQRALNDFYSAVLSQKRKPKSLAIDETLDNARMRGTLFLQDSAVAA